jgi:hypothetical protein
MGIELFALKRMMKALERWVTTSDSSASKEAVSRAKTRTTIAEMFAGKKKGFVIMPTEDADEIRETIIKNNQSQGRDTKVSDIQ